LRPLPPLRRDLRALRLRGASLLRRQRVAGAAKTVFFRARRNKTFVVTLFHQKSPQTQQQLR
jgi:hypothetical protein